MLLYHRPLVHLITNYVTANDTVNLILAAGGAAICADAREEVEGITSQAQGLVLNLGTPSPARAEAMCLAGQTANKMGIPVVLDPVGAGASSFRNAILSDLLGKVRFTCIRGNASEIAALCGRHFAPRGVEDAGETVAKEELLALSQKTGAVIAVTGKTCLVASGETLLVLPGGAPIQKRITGSGCMLSGLIGAMLADRGETLTKETSFACVCGALETYHAAARQAAAAAAGRGTASFRQALLDAVSLLRFSPAFLRLYAVTDRRWLGGRTLEKDVEEVLKGGATMVQLREKDLDRAALLQEAVSLTGLCHRYGVPLLVDDDAAVAKEAGADGVHVGTGDMAIGEARRILGPDGIVGATAHNREEALFAEKAGADYLGCGAAFGSATKKEAKPMTRETYADITSHVRIPVTAIGGIDADNVKRLRGLGLSGIAVISGIFAQEDIRGAARELILESGLL